MYVLRHNVKKKKKNNRNKNLNNERERGFFKKIKLENFYYKMLGKKSIQVLKNKACCVFQRGKNKEKKIGEK